MTGMALSQQNGRVTRPFSPLACWLVLWRVRLLLRTGGLVSALRWANRTRDGIPAISLADLFVKAQENVNVAAALFPGRAHCLERSLALQFVLGRCGIPTEIKFGAQPYRFRAHAWVEHAGVPVNESPETLIGLAVFPAVPV
jgi:hypothetical protein